MKSIFISSFHPLISRNILQTKVLEHLSLDCKVYILCPDYKAQFFKDNFESDNIHVLGVTVEPLGFYESLWKEFGNALLRTSTIRANRKERYLKNKKLFGYLIFLLINGTFARIKFIKKIYQGLSKYLIHSEKYTFMIDKYRPDVIFSTDIFHDEDVRLLASTKKMNLFSVGMVRSWDNPTNKGILPVVPKTIIVHNNVTLGELREFHSVPQSVTIIPTGIPQFDYYKDYKPKDPQDFYRWTGFHPENKTILFAPTGQKFVDDDWCILQAIHDAVKSGEIEDDSQILVRFPPGDLMDLSKLTLSNKVIVKLDYPGVEFNKETIKDRELSTYDMIKLADTLYYSDVLVSVGSTLCIDITAFDKPVICPNFKVPGIPYERSMVKMYLKHHYDYLVRTGACDVPRTKEEFLRSLVDALKEPARRRIGREKLMSEQMWKFDQNAGKRIVDIIKQHLMQ